MEKNYNIFQLEDIEYLSDEVFEEESEISGQNVKQENKTEECEEEEPEMEKEEPEFSLYQSNMLYLFFISGALICLALDITVQIKRRSELVDHREHVQCFKIKCLILSSRLYVLY